MYRPFIVALLIPAIIACDPMDSCDAAALEPASVQIGVGEKRFSPVDDGDELVLEWGNQGGAHVWVGVQTTGVVAGHRSPFQESEPGPELMFSLVDADGFVLGDGFSTEPLKGNERLAETAGQRLFMGYFDTYYYDDPDGIDWTDLTLRVELEDRCGTQLTDERFVSLAGL